MKRMRPLVYLSIIVLTITGVAMMLSNRHYLGTLDFGNSWAKVMVAKHVLVAMLIGLTVYAFEVLAPRVGREAAGGSSPKLAGLQKLQLRVATLGLTMALIVLLLTGIESAMSALP